MNIDNVIEKVTKEIRRKYTDCIFDITLLVPAITKEEQL